MEVKAKLKFLRMSPRKVRLIVSLVRGSEVGRALDQLKFANKKAAEPVAKLINSAVANAEHNFGLERNNLKIKEIKVDEAPTLKRWMPRAHGRATEIKKRGSHILVTLAEIRETAGVKQGKKPKAEKPVKLDHPAGEAPESKPAEAKAAKTEKDFERSKEEKLPDPRMEGHHAHAKAEGGAKGFAKKVFRRKSG